MDLLDPHGAPTIFGVSGYSGAGTKADGKEADGSPKTVPKIGPSDLRGGIRPYSLTDHIHERESSTHLSSLIPSTSSPSSAAAGSPFSLSFIPTVAPWFSGIISVLNAPLKQTIRASEVNELYAQKYGNERMCIVGKGVPDVTEAEGRHGWRMGGVQVHSGGKRVVVVGALDNLLKGAATQCMQNLNLALGYDELAGIPTDKI